MVHDKLFNLSIIESQGTLFEGGVYSLSVPAEDGYLQVLVDHAPLIATLKEGTVKIKDKKGDIQTWEIKGGFLEVSHNNANLILNV